jgi:hypothetical protein
VHLILEFRPALRMETWFETFFGLQKDGKINPTSALPNPLQWAIISREYEDEIYLASPPLLVQRVRFGLLATIGKLLGYEARYPAYSGVLLRTQFSALRQLCATQPSSASSRDARRLLSSVPALLCRLWSS